MLKLKQIGSNQTVLVLNDGTEILFSYETPVVVRTDEKILVTNQKFSNTTSKHINSFIGNFMYTLVDQSEIENFLN